MRDDGKLFLPNVSSFAVIRFGSNLTTKRSPHQSSIARLATSCCAHSIGARSYLQVRASQLRKGDHRKDEVWVGYAARRSSFPVRMGGSATARSHHRWIPWDSTVITVNGLGLQWFGSKRQLKYWERSAEHQCWQRPAPAPDRGSIAHARTDRADRSEPLSSFPQTQRFNQSRASLSGTEHVTPLLAS